MEILRQKLIADYNQNEKKRCWNNVKESLLALRENEPIKDEIIEDLIAEEHLKRSLYDEKKLLIWKPMWQRLWSITELMF